MTNTEARIAFSAKSTQRARKAYWAVVATPEAPAWRVTAAAQSLAISLRGLVAATGSEAKAQAAEVAYINSLIPA